MKNSTASAVPVTILDVARHAAVSPMTVSRVINGNPHVRPDTRLRVQASISRLGYVPNRLARGLIQRRTGTLAVVVPDISNLLFAGVARGVEEVAWHAGYHLILCDTHGDLERERKHLEDMLAFRVEGVLIAPVGDRSRANIDLLTRNHVPYVQIDRSVAGLDSDLVQGDGLDAAGRLVEHLLGRGHVRIGIVTGSAEISSARDRFEGYRTGLVRAGVAFDPALVAAPTGTAPLAAREAILRLLSLQERPTAIVAANSGAIVEVVQVARDLRLEIPNDLALACFDDAGYACRLDRCMTVMEQPAETYGTTAAQLVFDRVRDRARDRSRIVVVPSKLIVRQSSGAQTAKAA
jgi:LacI family transcriptional regulator